MKVSVIIPTYNRADRIATPLEALTKQTLRPDEVIVVIDGSKDNTAQVAMSFADKLPLKVIEIPNGGRSVARNTGVKNSTGELLVFFDDDMRPFPDCLSQHAEHHMKHPGCLFVGAIREDEKIFTSDIQRYRLKLYSRKGWVPEENDSLQPMQENNLYLAAANFSVSRKSFDELNGFDERLRDIEDFDLGVRALKAGYRIYGSHTKAMAFHDDPITCRYYILRQRQYYTSRQFLQSIKPELYNGLAKNYSVNVSPVKKMIFSIFSIKPMVGLVDSGLMRFVLPEKIRYKFYDLVIGGLSDVFPERKI